MSAVSTRHGTAIAALFALALVPVGWNTLRPRRVDPCRNPGELIATSLIPGTRSGGERWERRSADVIQWSEGTVPVPGDVREPLHFQIVRSYNARRLYANPLVLAFQKVEAEDHELIPVGSGSGQATIHLVHDHTQRRSRVIAYLYIYGNRPVSSAFLHQVAVAPRELIFGQRPLTLLLVAGTAPHRRTERADAAAKRWLTQAWEFYEKSCMNP